MNNTNQPSEVKTKNITLGSIIGWLVGIGAALAALGTISSKPLVGTLYIIVAIILIPPVSRWIEAQTHMRLSKGVKILAVLVLLGVIGANVNGPSSSNAVGSDSTKTAVQAEQAIQVTAPKIIADYKANEVSADAMYKGKLIEVKGIVSNIAKDIVDTPYITLSSGEQYGIESVQCMFTKEQEAELAGITKGKSITLQGRVSGKLMNVIVRECGIVQ